MTKEGIITQSRDDVRLEKYRFAMLCSGNAMILFALWAIVRTIIQLYYQADTVIEGVPVATLIVPVMASGAVDAVLKFIVGFSARAEGLGKRKNNIYIVLGIILVAMSIISLIIWISVISVFYKYDGLFGIIVSMAVEITVLYAELTLVISAIKVRKIEKEMGLEKPEERGER